jgi:SulP family sulfate permease
VAVTVALAVLAFAPLVRFIPKPALAALLLLTAVRLIEPRRIVYAFRASTLDAWALTITAVAGLAFGLDLAGSDRCRDFDSAFRPARSEVESQRVGRR